MSVMRSLLLTASQNRWLRERAPKHAFVRRAVSRFMPGEELDDMLQAARALAPDGIHAVFTRLGENVTDWAEADAVASHYLDAIDRVRSLSPPPEPSVKLTQLGLDLDSARCYPHVRPSRSVQHATGNPCGSTWSRRRTSTSRWTSCGVFAPSSLGSASACRRICIGRPTTWRP